jgi:hypothetical protein
MSLEAVAVIGACALSSQGLAYDVGRFAGKDAVSPRLIVDELSPWVSDRYPNLIRSVDLDAVATSGNRLYCETQAVRADGAVECRVRGEVSSYKYLGRLKDGIHVFLTSSSGETGTYVAITYRFVSIDDAAVYAVDGKREKHAVMTLVRDVPLESKAGFKHAFTSDGTAFEIESERFQDGKKTQTTVRFDPAPAAPDAPGVYLCEALCTYKVLDEGIRRTNLVSKNKDQKLAWQALQDQCAELRALAERKKVASSSEPLLVASKATTAAGSSEYEMRPATLERDCVGMRVDERR